MARPKGSASNLHERRAEWLLVRETALLGDVVDEATFIGMLGVQQKTFRTNRSRGVWYGIEIPKPIYRPEGSKPIWLKAEAEAFSKKFKAKRLTRER